MKRIVLIGDIISSKKIKKREEIQKNLQKIFKRVNEKNKDIISPLTITLGDEFQAVYGKADLIFKNLWQIMLAVYPEKIRFSLGIGEINTRINRKQAIGMDGPAFYNARSGLNELKQSSFLFNVSGEANLNLIRESLYLISHNSYAWKETRLNIMSLLYEQLSVNDISDLLKITDKAVYKNIDAGALQTIKKLTDEIADFLNNILKKN